VLLPAPDGPVMALFVPFIDGKAYLFENFGFCPIAFKCFYEVFQFFKKGFNRAVCARNIYS